MTAAVVGLEDWSALQKRMERKTTFAAAVQDCLTALGAVPPPLLSEAFLSLVKRARTLLKTRYTGPEFWIAAKSLFTAARDQAAASPALVAELDAALSECSNFLGERDTEEGPSSTAASRGSADPSDMPDDRPSGGSTTGSAFLFEGQLSGSEAPAPRLNPLFAALSAMAARQTAQQAVASDTTAQPGGAVSEDPLMSEEASAALERELDAIAVEIMDATAGQAPRAAPPAAKKAVASLPRERLTEEALAAMGGGDARCPVCMEDLEVGDEMQALPCQHRYHPDCLKPWLEEHNTCPACRHELPTDDAEYDRRRMRELEEEEERRGARNALTHSEFLYI